MRNSALDSKESIKRNSSSECLGGYSPSLRSHSCLFVCFPKINSRAETPGQASYLRSIWLLALDRLRILGPWSGTSMCYSPAGLWLMATWLACSYESYDKSLHLPTRYRFCGLIGEAFWLQSILVKSFLYFHI